MCTPGGAEGTVLDRSARPTRGPGPGSRGPKWWPAVALEEPRVGDRKQECSARRLTGLLGSRSQGLQGAERLPGVAGHQAQHHATEADATGHQRSQAGEDRQITLEELETSTTFDNDGVRKLELYQE
jgi:hypothetical protein